MKQKIRQSVACLHQITCHRLSTNLQQTRKPMCRQNVTKVYLRKEEVAVILPQRLAFMYRTYKNTCFNNRIYQSILIGPNIFLKTTNIY
jgi:hypothetical protein